MDPSSPRALSLSLVLLLLCCTVVAGFVLPWAQSLVQSSNPTAPFLHPSSPRAAGVRVAMSATDSAEGPTFSPEVLALLDSKGLEMRYLSEANLQAAIKIETASYPEDEAASPENIGFRRANAGAFFLEATFKKSGGGGEAGELAGFVCGTLSQGEELSHESMHLHDADGATLCIHSVAVAEKFRRRGYATAMLKAYVESVALAQPGVRRICLIAKAGLLGMYASAGFSLKGLSPVVHGKDPWFEMRTELDSTEPRLLRFVQVDAFSETKFGGNPAAVFFTQAGGDADWMQKVAIEMNLSETCFLELKPYTSGDLGGPAAAATAAAAVAVASSSLGGSGGGGGGGGPGPEYALRWFTPGGEVDLCGHATLAAAFALWEEGRVDPGLPVRFSTASGVLTCRRDAEGWVAMDFPAEAVGAALSEQDVSRTAIVKALGLAAGGGEVLFVGRNRFDIMVEVTPEAFATLKPDMRLLAAVESRGVLVTCKGGDGGGGSSAARGGAEGGGGGGGGGGGVVDFQSRFFAPRLGIDEDPVTGSAHCCLAPYWAAKLGRDSVVGYQASARGGTVRATLVAKKEGSDRDQDRVILEGKAVTVFRGLFRR